MIPKEKTAFVEAYASSVAYAPSEYVADFVARLESGEDMQYCEHYTSIMDALGVWHQAIKYAITQGD